MKRATLITSLCLAVLLGLASTATLAQPGGQEQPKAEAEKKAEKQAMPLCPVSGKPINFAVSLMAEDGPVYFCSPDCPPKYKADPKQFAEKVAAQRKALEGMPKVQVTCPVTGKPIDKKVFVEKDGKKIFFCSKECPAAYEKEPAKYAAKLAGSYTYQTKCPVSGETISPASFVTLEGGMKIYFCCGGCIPRFEKEPGKYLPKLKDQGFTLDAEKMKIVAKEAGKGMEMEAPKEKPKEPAKSPAKEPAKEKEAGSTGK